MLTPPAESVESRFISSRSAVEGFERNKSCRYLANTQLVVGREAVEYSTVLDTRITSSLQRISEGTNPTNRHSIECLAQTAQTPASHKLWRYAWHRLRGGVLSPGHSFCLKLTFLTQGSAASWNLTTQQLGPRQVYRGGPCRQCRGRL